MKPDKLGYNPGSVAFYESRGSVRVGVSAHNNEPSNVSREQFLLLTYFLGVLNKYFLVIY